tara:strand:+ start:936 stop:1907 length:972 start_codon:yes stop_codon:yes gene_type:complete
MGFIIKNIEYALPRNYQKNDYLQKKNKSWNIKKIEKKTGIFKRFVSDKKENVITLAIKSTKKILKKHYKNKIDFILFISQTHNNDLTSASCLIQNHFSLKKNLLAIDLNVGCSGFIYGLKFAESLLNEKNYKSGLVICSDTYTKHISDNNRSSKPIFSDGSAAILVNYSKFNSLCKFTFGSDGSGFRDLRILEKDQQQRPFLKKNDIFMDGNKIALFTMSVIPKNIILTLKKNNMKLKDIDLIFFHQASKYVIDNLIRILNIPLQKVFVNYKNLGNTISSSIPIALKMANKRKILKNNHNIMLVGFGVGLSWGSTIIKWKKIQ